MKVNDIRKLAKEIRTGRCNLAYEEISAIAEEIREYANGTAAEAWTDRTKQFVESDMADIEMYINAVNPVTEDIPDGEEKVVRRNFKTILRKMADKANPVLEAVRWFATVYARDGYEKARMVKGMVVRRGFDVADCADGFEILDRVTKDVLATVGVDGVDVCRFMVW